MTDATTAIARLETQMQNLSERWERIEPLLLARSGDLERLSRFERDLNGLGEKWRTSERKIEANYTEHHSEIERLESRQNKALYLVLGGVAVLQFIASEWLGRLIQAIRS